MRTAASLFSPLACNAAVFQHTNNGRLWGILSSSSTSSSSLPHKPPRCDRVPENRLTTATIKLCHASLSHSTHRSKSQFILKLFIISCCKERRKTINGASFSPIYKSEGQESARRNLLKFHSMTDGSTLIWVVFRRVFMGVMHLCSHLHILPVGESPLMAVFRRMVLKNQ